MTAQSVDRDERTTAIENVGYRWAYLVLSFGLLADVAFRSFAHGESSWDLFALIILGGAVHAGYQAWHRVLYRRWVLMSVVTMVAAAIVAVATVLLRRPAP